MISDNATGIVISVFYPQAKEFVFEYIDSLNNQTTKNFKLYAFNDGFEYLELLLRDNLNVDFKVIDVPSIDLGIAKARHKSSCVLSVWAQLIFEFIGTIIN